MAERVAEIIIGKNDVITLRTEVQLNIYDLVDAATQDQLFDMIVNIDSQVSEWSFTERLHEHFAKEHEKFLEEIQEETDGEQVPE